MAGETRIIAFGANGQESGAGQAPVQGTLETTASSDSEMNDTVPWDADESEPAETSKATYLLPALAGALIIAWTAFYAWSQWDAFAVATAAQIPAMMTQWAVPVLLVVVTWLLAMRSSRREAGRFGDAAALLSRESTNLETRLSTINGELSLAREFIAAQSRDLESLGRLAVERLTQNADRLQALIHENGGRLDTIQTVSQSALENMDRLRSQLPVIASSAKDVTNHIGNAGRTAHVQLDELVGGVGRLNEAGAACAQQVATVRGSMEAAAAEFTRTSEDLERLAAARFDILAERGAEFRTRLENDEVQALAAIRTRATALEQEVEGVRRALDGHEAESLTSLRARLTALRDESGVVGRALQDSETRASDAWIKRLAAIEATRSDIEARLEETERATLETLRERTDSLARRSEDLRNRLFADDQANLAALEERTDRIRARASELQSQIAAGEQAALTRITAQLASLDGAIAERLAEHERHSDSLVWRSEALAGALGDHGERIAAVARSSSEVEAAVSRSLAVLSDRLTASRTTLAATESEIERLTHSSVRLLELIQASAKHSSGVLPEALSVADDRLSLLGDKVLHLIDDIETGSRRSGDLHASIEGLRDALASVQAQIEAGQSSISERNETHYAELGALRASLEDVERTAGRVEAKARTELGGAVEHLAGAVRHVLAALDDEASLRIKAMADRLGEESAGAIDRVMRPRAAEAAGALEQAVAHASGAGREAAIQMREQLAAVEEAVGHLEARVEQARERAQEQVDNDFSRRAALITDSLKSNAIDIASALSSDVADTAWSSYLRGDRGIFARRAVSLLEAGEIKAIQQLFERDDSFRENVSRYIHDFEALLRQVLSTRDGNALGVTLLSSDMGKLYVALAQGIERLRT
jgi:predicted  nucleic acid-binding Zn-ribbon protein